MRLPKHARNHPTFSTRRATVGYWIDITIIHALLLVLVGGAVTLALGILWTLIG